MASTRFVTVRDLYEAFPIAQGDVGAEPSDAPPLDFLRKLVDQENWDGAVSFCAYLLPRREAVWWGCRSLRRIQPQRSPKDTMALDLAEAWVGEPEENRRRAALTYGSEGDHQAAATWMALAAGWSGGSVVASELGHAPAAPYQTARAVRACLLGALAWVATDDVGPLMRACLADGVRLADGSAVST